MLWRLYRGDSLVALGESTAQNGQELLAEFIQYGHQKPFEEIVRRYAGMVFNVCFRITKDKHEAEDATQAVFLTLALQAKRGTDIKALGPWLQQVAKRLALDNRRSKKRRQTREERHQQETDFRRECIDGDSLPSADLDELKTILHEELQKMPTKYRLPLILHYFGGLTRDEMAAELNCKPSTLGVRIFRGREMLAGRLSGRGINITPALLAAAMGYAVKQAISETLISNTAHAATAMAMGHSGAGMASAHVIGLTRQATGALAVGKVKVAAITLLLSSVSLGAGAKALGILPAIDVRQMITNQMQRLIRPLMQPFTQPLRVDARPTTPAPIAPAVTVADQTDLVALIPHSSPIAVHAVSKTKSAAPVTAVAIADEAPLASAWTVPANSVATPHAMGAAMVASIDHSSSTATAIHASDSSESSDSSSSAGGGGGGSLDLAAMYKLADAIPTAMRAATGNTQSMSDVMLTMNDLVVGSASSTGAVRTSLTSAATSTAASPMQIVQISAIGGTVTENSDGVIRGWGKIQRTGTLDMNGKVVADGQGVDRTLNLTAFSAVQTQTAPVDTSTATAAATVSPEGNGWFAVNHGRLELPLKPSSTSTSTLTWGDDPNAANLSLVNSVRLDLSTAVTAPATDPVPAELALLSPDRDDAPCLSQISGVAIGLWQVDPTAGDITAADLNIVYDSSLASELGASASSVQLWTMGGSSDDWQPVALNTLEVDAANHTVSGYAQDFDYFAVSVIPAPGEDAAHTVAHHLAQLDSGSSSSSSVQSVPEPIALPLVVIGAGILSRRRRLSRV